VRNSPNSKPRLTPNARGNETSAYALVNESLQVVELETIFIALGYGRSSSPLMHTVNLFFSIMLLAETCPARDSIPIQYVHLGLAQHAAEVDQNLPELSQLQDRHDKDTLAVIGIFNQ